MGWPGQQSVMECSNCGAVVSADGEWCPSCSEAMAGEAETTPGQSRGQQGSSQRAGQHARQMASGGWSRRDLLKYGGGSVVGLGALAWFFTGGGPAATVKKYFEALDRGDTETAKRMAHDDGFARPGSVITAQYTDAAVSVDGTTVTKNTGSEAVVETTLTVASTDSPESTTSVVDVVLEKTSGQWKIMTVSYS